MAVERFNLLTEDKAKALSLEAKIKSGEITSENFSTLNADEQEKVKDILFEMSSSKIDPNEGASTIEFILMAFIRLTTKKMNDLPLNSEDLKIEEQLERILQMHEITNDTPMDRWLFDYMSYAQYKTSQFLGNRKEHIERKKNVTGEV